MLVIAVVGIRFTARTQVGMAFLEYGILVGFGIAGLLFVLAHSGYLPGHRGWLSVTGIGGKGSATAGFLIAVFMFTGWDGTLYVNEEVRHRRRNPGKAAIMAVLVLAVLYSFTTVGLQGVVSPAKLQANSASALVYIAQALGGSGWAKVMALGLALSVVATTGTGIVLTARIVYGMASYRVLPEFLANVSPPVQDPGRGQRHRRAGDHRPGLGVPAGHLGAERVQRRGRGDRAAVRHLLHPDRAGHHHLLPAPPGPAAGRRDPRRAAGRPPPVSWAGSSSSRCWPRPPPSCGRWRASPAPGWL